MAGRDFAGSFPGEIFGWDFGNFIFCPNTVDDKSMLLTSVSTEGTRSHLSKDTVFLFKVTISISLGALA